MCIFKSFRNKIFAAYFIPLRLTIENSVPVINCFIHHIPAIHTIFIAVYNSGNMFF